MKIQCDVCTTDEASVFCTADEAALCDACDHRVHHANRLASKHQRFSLLHPSSKNTPLCDICQEKRAFLFCQQDRAILCRDCDVPIHKANELTQKHNRFLLTGVKLSATSTLFMSSSSSSSSSSVTTVNGDDTVPEYSKSQKQPARATKQPVSISKTLSSNPTVNKNLPCNITVNKEAENLLINEGIGSTSSISEYLIETLPGWHVEDFLDFPSSPFGFCKPDDGILPFRGADLGSSFTPFSPENMAVWVPPNMAAWVPPNMAAKIGLKETKEALNTKVNDRRGSDEGFTVPEISPQSIGSKRSSPFW